MMFPGLAVALLAAHPQEPAAPITPQAQFDAWVAGLPKDCPRPLVQTFTVAASLEVHGAEDESTRAMAEFLGEFSVEGEVLCFIANERRFRHHFDLRVRGGSGADRMEVTLRGGLAGDAESLRFYGDAAFDGDEPELLGASIAWADAERVYDEFRAAVPALVGKTESGASGWYGSALANLPTLPEMLHPRGYALSSICPLPIHSYAREGRRVSVSFAMDAAKLREVLTTGMALDSEADIDMAHVEAMVRSLRQVMTVDAETGQPLSLHLAMDLPLAAVELDATGVLRVAMSAESEGFEQRAPSEEELAPPGSREWFDLGPFVELAISGLRREVADAEAGQDEEF